MGRKFITPLGDAAIYQQFPTRNTGIDEILEVGKSRVASGSVRALIQFSDADIAALTSSADPAATASFYLNLRIATADNLVAEQQIEVYEVTQSWDEGTGFFVQDLENAKDGATWLIADNSDVTWSFDATASIGSSAGGATGSLTTPDSVVTFGFEPNDVRLDISDTVRRWSSGTIANNGILIKIPTANEENSNIVANFKFFSKNTHTIYPPTLEAVWNTQTINVTPNCGLSLAPEEFELFIPNARMTIPTGSTTRIRFGLRTSQPIKSFSDTFRFSNKFYLNSGSHVGIQDAATRAFVIPFDSGSFISADSTGSYFDFKVENMFIGRTYNILVRVEKPWGSEIIETGHSFRVT